MDSFPGEFLPIMVFAGRFTPERNIFFRLQVYERVGLSLVEVCERVGKSVFSVCKMIKVIKMGYRRILCETSF